jgi:hypothetical protein
MTASGIVLVVLGVWLVTQALGGNLTGRIRGLAAS